MYSKVVACSLFLALAARGVTGAEGLGKPPLPPDHIMSITGRATASAWPDQVEVGFRVWAYADNPGRAEASDREKLEQILRQMEQLGVERKAVQTTFLGTTVAGQGQFIRDTAKEGPPMREVLLYGAQYQVSLTEGITPKTQEAVIKRVNGIDLLAATARVEVEKEREEVERRLFPSGYHGHFTSGGGGGSVWRGGGFGGGGGWGQPGEMVEGIRFSVQDPARLSREAVRLAAEDARQQAETVAEALGVRIKDIRSIQAQNPYGYSAASNTYTQLALSAEVIVQYEFEMERKGGRR